MNPISLDDIIARLAGLPKETQDEILKAATDATANLAWIPNPGPQTDAYFSEADELFYGGQAGGGKTDLELGLALTAHERSLVLRRTNKEATGLVERMIGMLNGDRSGWNSQLGSWHRPDGRVVDIGGCEHEHDKEKRKGHPHDLICFDEVSDFTETQYVFICAWNRSAKPGQRCRIVAAGNPPTRPEGRWVVDRWGAWLDPQHPNPAMPGELRWYLTGPEGKEIEVDGPGPHDINGRPTHARSRTFIPAKLSDNPDLAKSEYGAVLDALPADLQSAYRDGNFGATLEEQAFQAIPTAWVRAAQARWTPVPPAGVAMNAMGVDIAQGGKDNTVIARRYDGWYPPLVVIKGKDTPDGKTAAGAVIAHRHGGAKVIVDLGGGWGGDALAHLVANGVDAVGYMGIKKSNERTADKFFKLTNVRSAAYWRFREALDPSQPQGSVLCLPQDPILLADLCAPTYDKTPQGIAIESKEKVCARLGRSTDRGDAVVMAWYHGLKASNIKGGYAVRSTHPDQAIMSSKYRRRA